MTTFEHLKSGDKVTRLQVYKTDRAPLEYAGEVVEVTETTVSCLIWVDTPRMMKFYRVTGVATDGIEYGWLKDESTQARLTLAHELIAALTNNGQLSPRLMTPETKALWERWQAEQGKL